MMSLFKQLFIRILGFEYLPTMYLLLFLIKVYTSAGKAALKVLNEECIEGIFKEAKKDYFSADDFEGGLKFMVQEYK